MNIFVAKLSYDTSEHTLRDAFEAYGEVESVKIIMDREQGRSKGFGFVEMPDTNEANDAISALNDSTIDGRTVVVKESQPKDNSGGGRRGGGGGYSRDRY